MGLDICVRRITKDVTEEHQELFNRTTGELCRYNFPDWTREYENDYKLEVLDYDKFKEKYRLDLNLYENTGYEILENDIYLRYYNENGIEKLIRWDDIPKDYIPIKIINYYEVGYQRKGMKPQFYDNFVFDNDYFVWTKEKLEFIRDNYASDPKQFNYNIIKNFEEGKDYVVFDW